jgi:hypothetical protein
MSLRIVFEGQAVKSEMVVLMLEKWELHPQMEEKIANPNPDDLARDTRVLVPEAEFERAREILFGESEVERAEF